MDPHEKNIPSNSFRSRERQVPEKREPLEPVVRKRAYIRKDSGIKRFIRLFFIQDFQAVKDEFVEEQLVPGIKDLIQRAVDAILWENGRRSPARRRSGQTDYAGVSKKKGSPLSGTNPNRVNYARPATHARADNIIFESRSEAEEVLRRMDDLLQTYEQVTVADMRQLSGFTCEAMDNVIGWRDLRSAYISRTRDGFVIELPDYINLRR